MALAVECGEAVDFSRMTQGVNTGVAVVIQNSTIILIPSCTAVTSSCAIIRYEPSPTST